MHIALQSAVYCDCCAADDYMMMICEHIKKNKKMYSQEIKLETNSRGIYYYMKIFMEFHIKFFSFILLTLPYTFYIYIYTFLFLYIYICINIIGKC